MGYPLFAHVLTQLDISAGHPGTDVHSLRLGEIALLVAKISARHDERQLIMDAQLKYAI